MSSKDYQDSWSEVLRIWEGISFPLPDGLDALGSSYCATAANDYSNTSLYPCPDTSYNASTFSLPLHSSYLAPFTPPTKFIVDEVPPPPSLATTLPCEGRAGNMSSVPYRCIPGSTAVTSTFQPVGHTKYDDLDHPTTLKQGWSGQHTEISDRADRPVETTEHPPVATETPCYSGEVPKSSRHGVSIPALKCSLINAWSMIKHSAEVRDLILLQELDVLFVTESWITDTSGPALDIAIPPGYSILATNRMSGVGGGVAVVFRRELGLFRGSTEPITECESILVKLTLFDSFCINFLLIYRPPRDMAHFQGELMDSLVQLAKCNTATIVLGDFNLWLGDPTDKKAGDLETALDDLHFSQISVSPTHIKGHTLDWIAANNITCTVSTAEPCPWTDHFNIPFVVHLPSRPKISHAPIIKTQSRNLRKLSEQAISGCLDNLMLITSDTDPPELLAEVYNKTFLAMLDNFAPMKDKKVRQKARSQAWWSPELDALRKAKRLSERVWVKSREEGDKIEWRKCQGIYKDSIDKAKREHYNHRIRQSDNNVKELFSILEELKHPIAEDSGFAPTSDDCNRAQNHFRNKILKARDKIKQELTTPQPVGTPLNPKQAPMQSKAIPALFNFKPISCSDMMVYLKKLRPTAVSNDVCPLKIILQYPLLFAPFLTRFTNASFLHNSVPSSIKKVQVTPLIKKPGQDPRDANNLRPITNVVSLLKIIDKIATDQFQSFLEDFNILHPRQSGFRKGHSTETALVDLQSHMLKMIDEGKTGLLILLDLSAAFDLLDHHILTDRLVDYGIFTPGAVKWINSFLSDRTAVVGWGGAFSQAEPLIYGVPQGACLSPALFNIYTRPLFDLLEERGVMFTNFADDTQLLVELSEDPLLDQVRVDEIYGLIKGWMSANWMCLNSTKTEIMIVANARKLESLHYQYNSLLIDGCQIHTVRKVKTLGVTLDSALTMDCHASALVSSSCYYLKLIRHIRPFLSPENCATIARAVISTRLDYCNGLLAGTSNKNLEKIQVVQNNAIRVIKNVPRRHHISNHRRDLHWLPIRARVEFKALSMTHKSLHNEAPQYLNDMVSFYHPARALRSQDQYLAKQHRVKRAGGLGRALFTHGSSMWNHLPLALRAEVNGDLFKRQLKTLLFNKY